MDVVAAPSEFGPERGCEDAATADQRITGDADLQRARRVQSLEQPNRRRDLGERLHEQMIAHE